MVGEQEDMETRTGALGTVLEKDGKACARTGQSGPREEGQFGGVKDL